MVGGTAPPVSVSQQKAPRDLQAVWVIRVHRDPQGSRVLRGFQDTRAREEMRAHLDPQDPRGTREVSEFLGFRVWRESRVTRVRLVVLVFLVWMDVMGPEETEELPDVLENEDKMETRV